MRRPPQPSRRDAIAALAVGGSADLAGRTSVYSALPDRISYARTRRRTVPDVPSPVSVTDDHLRELPDEIGECAADGLEAWAEPGEPERAVVYSERRLEDAAAFADDLPSEPPTPEALGSARYHLSRAAGGLAYAQVRIERLDDAVGVLTDRRPRSIASKPARLLGCTFAVADRTTGMDGTDTDGDGAG